jgi:PTS system mannose-specific IIA component
MLIKLSSIRKGDNMQASLEEAQAAGRKYINVASQLLASK